MVIIITGSTNKPVACDSLTKFFAMHDEYSGFLYIGYPLIATEDDLRSADAMWVSKEKGVVIFDLAEEKHVEDVEDRQDELYTKVDARLRASSSLVKKRELMVKVNVVTYGPSIEPEIIDKSYFVCNDTTLKDALDTYSWDHPEYYERTLSELQAVSNLRRSTQKRSLNHDNSRGAILYWNDQISGTDIYNRSAYNSR